MCANWEGEAPADSRSQKLSIQDGLEGALPFQTSKGFVLVLVVLEKKARVNHEGEHEDCSFRLLPV